MVPFLTRPPAGGRASPIVVAACVAAIVASRGSAPAWAAPGDADAGPCRPVAAYLSRRFDELNAPQATDAAIPGLTEGEREDRLLGEPACAARVEQRRGDDGVGGMLVAALTTTSPATAERFSLALATLASLRPSWARTTLRDALATGRGHVTARAVAFAALADLDPQGAADAAALLAERAKAHGRRYGTCVDPVVAMALTRSTALRARAAPVVTAARKGERCGFDAVWQASCSARSAPTPEVKEACERADGNESSSRQNDENRKVLLQLGIGVAFAAAGTAAAWKFSDNDGGRAAAVALAGFGGAGLGYVAATSERCDGPLCGFHYLFGMSLGALTGLLGGVIGFATTGDPGESRGVTASVAAVALTASMIELATREWEH